MLADTNDQEGVVTAVALSVELQAGRLTEEHVDFVSPVACEERQCNLATYSIHIRWSID